MVQGYSRTFLHSARWRKRLDCWIYTKLHLNIESIRHLQNSQWLASSQCLLFRTSSCSFWANFLSEFSHSMQNCDYMSNQGKGQNSVVWSKSLSLYRTSIWSDRRCLLHQNISEAALFFLKLLSWDQSEFFFLYQADSGNSHSSTGYRNSGFSSLNSKAAQKVRYKYLLLNLMTLYLQ